MFALYLVVLTVFFCVMSIAMFFVEQSTGPSSLVSPVEVLRTADDLEVFEMLERDLIRSSLESADGEFGSGEFYNSFRDGFIDGVMSNENMKSFLFENLFVDGVEVREQDKNRNLLESRIYPEGFDYFVDGESNFDRAKIEKRVLLVAKNKRRINFPVYFSFEFERKYLISKVGEEFGVDRV